MYSVLKLIWAFRDVEDLKLQLAAISKEKEQMVEKSTEKEHLIQQLQQEIQELSEKNKVVSLFDRTTSVFRHLP